MDGEGQEKMVRHLLEKKEVGNLIRVYEEEFVN